MKYRLLKDSVNGGVPAGSIVYDCDKYDYGLAYDDTRHTGIEHVFVTMQSDGGYPGFTCPSGDLVPVKE